jgi:hypothetical protein
MSNSTSPNQTTTFYITIKNITYSYNEQNDKPPSTYTFPGFTNDSSLDFNQYKNFSTNSKDIQIIINNLLDSQSMSELKMILEKIYPYSFYNFMSILIDVKNRNENTIINYKTPINLIQNFYMNFFNYLGDWLVDYYNNYQTTNSLTNYNNQHPNSMVLIQKILSSPNINFNDAERFFMNFLKAVNLSSSDIGNLPINNKTNVILTLLSSLFKNPKVTDDFINTFYFLENNNNSSTFFKLWFNKNLHYLELRPDILSLDLLLKLSTRMSKNTILYLKQNRSLPIEFWKEFFVRTYNFNHITNNELFYQEKILSYDYLMDYILNHYNRDLFNSSTTLIEKLIKSDELTEKHALRFINILDDHHLIAGDSSTYFINNSYKLIAGNKKISKTFILTHLDKMLKGISNFPLNSNIDVEVYCNPKVIDNSITLGSDNFFDLFWLYGNISGSLIDLYLRYIPNLEVNWLEVFQNKHISEKYILDHMDDIEAGYATIEEKLIDYPRPHYKYLYSSYNFSLNSFINYCNSKIENINESINETNSINNIFHLLYFLEVFSKNIDIPQENIYFYLKFLIEILKVHPNYDDLNFRSFTEPIFFNLITLRPDLSLEVYDLWDKNNTDVYPNLTFLIWKYILTHPTNIPQEKILNDLYVRVEKNPKQATYGLYQMLDNDDILPRIIFSEAFLNKYIPIRLTKETPDKNILDGSEIFKGYTSNLFKSLNVLTENTIRYLTTNHKIDLDDPEYLKSSIKIHIANFNRKFRLNYVNNELQNHIPINDLVDKIILNY